MVAIPHVRITSFRRPTRQEMIDLATRRAIVEWPTVAAVIRYSMSTWQRVIVPPDIFASVRREFSAIEAEWPA